ncbi:FCPA [Symbiodinium natans]|uniref:FCPA protein n=1 Tax=Symbiodinium natans TaxID=878477 RepID=A0A812VD07_9DINO|nr:FCPA [Symbiodinium natans]
MAVAAGAAATLASTAFVQSSPAGQAAPERSSTQLRGRIVAAQTSGKGSSSSSLLGCTAAASASALLASQLRGKANYSRKSQVVVSAFESELGVQSPFGFWDPIGFTADGDVDAFKRRRATELKHGRIAMLATMGYMTPEITGKFPGYLSPSMDIKFADVPNGLAAISKVPVAGWAQILAYMSFCEISQKQDPGTKPYDGDFGWKVLTSDDPEIKKKKLNSELANGRLAMVGIIGLFFQDGITGSPWGYWAGNPSSFWKAFESELGVQAPVGFWDPAGLSNLACRVCDVSGCLGPGDYMGDDEVVRDFARAFTSPGFVAGLWKCAEWCQTLAGRHGWSSVPKSSGNWMRGMLRDEAAGEKEDVAVRATFRRLMREERRRHMVFKIVNQLLAAVKGERPAKLEDGLSDWSATGRARWEGLKALDERTQALVKAKTGLWQVKDELYTLVMSDLDPLLDLDSLSKMSDAAKQARSGQSFVQSWWGCQPLLEQARETESQRVLASQREGGEILLQALSEELSKCPQACQAVPETWRTELTQVFRAEFLVGVFSVGGKFSSSELVDIRFGPGLQGLRTRKQRD